MLTQFFDLMRGELPLGTVADLVCLQTRSLMDQNNCVDICQPSGHLKLEEQPRWTVLGLVCLQNETSYGSERLCRHTSMSTQRCHLKLQGTATLDCSRPRLLTKRGRLFLICVSQPHCTVRAHKWAGTSVPLQERFRYSGAVGHVLQSARNCLTYNVLLTKTRIFEVQFALGLVRTRSHPSVAVAKQRGIVVTGRAQ